MAGLVGAAPPQLAAALHKNLRQVSSVTDITDR